jgi:hypothetical protein
LGRLNAAPTPPTAATQLKVATPPLADPARYDSLRADNSASRTTDNVSDSDSDSDSNSTIKGADHEA